jgi:hypothetical protein
MLSLLVVFFGFAARGARPQKDDAAASPNERKIENAVSEHAPVKVKLRNEKSFKDARNKNWARELEIEVKNVGDKPIYFVNVAIVMPEIIIDGGKFMLGTSYGRTKLKLPETPVEDGDVPILPGESVKLKIRDAEVEAFEHFRDEERRWEDPKRIKIEVQIINFGDGTFMFGREGILRHATPKKQSFDNLRKRWLQARLRSVEARFDWRHIQSALLVAARKPLAGEFFTASKRCGIAPRTG